MKQDQAIAIGVIVTALVIGLIKMAIRESASADHGQGQTVEQIATDIVKKHNGKSAFAQDTTFRRVQLPYGISLEIPSHWTVLPQEATKNLRDAASAMLDNAGIEVEIGQKQTLLAANATPNPVGAMIRVSVTSPPDFTQADLAAFTATDLKEVGAEVLKMYRQAEASGGPEIIEMQPVRIEKFNEQPVLVMSYVRASKVGSSPWQVTLHRIPVSDRLIDITLSHRQSDAIIWQPILERVKRSVQFSLLPANRLPETN